MSLFVKQNLIKTKNTFQALPKWQKITIALAMSVASVTVAIKLYIKLKPAPPKKKEETEYHPNVPHYTAQQVVNCHNGHGECCVWDARKQLFCWIDYTGKQFWTYDPKTKATKTYTTPEKVGSFALCEDGSLFFAFASGPAFYDLETGKLSKKIYEFEPAVLSRMNDGRCDRNGRFVVGGVIDFHTSAPNIFLKMIYALKNRYQYKYGKKSAIHRINEDLSHEVLVENVMCSNAICFSVDGKTMYYADSFQKQINKMDYYEDKRLPTNERMFTNKFKGFPDGSCVDVNDNVWNASFGIGKVTCMDKNGDVIMVVDVPAKCVTCCCLGGENLNVLFITTLDGKTFDIDDGEYAGNAFAVEIPNVTGCLENRFKGESE